MSEMAVGNIPEVTYVNDWILIKESNGNLKTTKTSFMLLKVQQ